MKIERKVELLCKKDKKFKKLFKLMFDDFGWDCTVIHEDSLKIYNIFKEKK